MSIWVCEEGHVTGPFSPGACPVCGAKTQRTDFAPAQLAQQAVDAFKRQENDE